MSQSEVGFFKCRMLKKIFKIEALLIIVVVAIIN